MKKTNVIERFTRLIPSGKKGFFFVYTGLFVLMSVFVFSLFIINKKGFVWEADGYMQHYKAFMYFGQWGREIITTLFTQGKLEIPLWDFSIGYGSDVITSMHYYAYGDFLNLVSVAIPQKYSELGYDLLVVIRMYLAGISFSLFSFKMNKRRSAILAGAIAYSFCGYSFFAGIRHPFFMNAMIYLPLVILGAEKILRKEPPLLFVFAIFITTLSNFYFLYMTAVAVVLYVVIRYFTMEREKTIKDFAINILKFALSSILGIGMACIIFLPAVQALLSSSRISQPGGITGVFYDLAYYGELITGMFSSASPIEWTCTGFSAPIFVAVVIMFMSRKKYTGLKIGLIILLIMACLPIVGKIMNGFSYVSNRWTYILAGLMAYILVAVWEDMLRLKRKQLIGLLVSSGVYFLFLIVLRETTGIISFVALGIIFITIILLIINCSGSLAFLTKRVASIGLVLLVAMSCCLNGFYKYIGYTDEFLPYNKGFENIEKSSDKALANAVRNEDSFVRTDQKNATDINASVITGNYSTHFFWSLENGAVSTFLLENSYCNFIPQQYDGLNCRTFLEALASVKYFAKTKSTDAPYGYKEVDKVTMDNTLFTICKNQNPLPLGYSYSSYIDKQSYLEMDAFEKQQAMLQGVVLENTREKDLSEYNEANPKYTHQVVDSKITLGEGVVKKKDGSFLVNEDGATIAFTFNGMKNSETYLHLSDIYVDTLNEYELFMDDCQEYFSKEEFNALSSEQQNKLKIFDFCDVENKSDMKIVFKVKSGKNTQILKHLTENFRYATGQSDYLVNMGYSEKGKSQIVLKFPKKGIYKFDKLEIVCQPMDDFNGYVDALKEDIMVNEVMGTNSVSGEITLKEDKILTLSIPYSQGWKATVDGEEVELLQANSMYMAIPLKAGKHEIKLNYETPMLKAGVIVSMISFGIFIGIAFRRRGRVPLPMIYAFGV